MSTAIVISELASSKHDILRKTIVSAPNCGGLQGHHPWTIPLLTQRHIKVRLKFAYDHVKQDYQ